MDAAQLRGTDPAIWAGVRSGQSHCRVWLFLGWQLPCPAFVQTAACRQSLPLSPKKPREPVAALQPIPSPATNSCCREGRVLGSTWCHHSCRETPTLWGGGRILQAMSDLQNCLWVRGCGLGCGGTRGMKVTIPGMLSELQQQNLWQPSLSLSCSATGQAVIFD